MGWSEPNSTHTILLPDPDNPTLEPKIMTLSYTEPELSLFKILPLREYEFFEFSLKIESNLKISFSNPQKALPCAEPRHLTY